MNRDDLPPDVPARVVIDRAIFFAVLALPALFVWASARMRGADPDAVASAARTVAWVGGIVLVAFCLGAMLRDGHGNARMSALGCLVLSVGGLAALREIAGRAAVTAALARRGHDVAVGDPGLVTPVRVVTVALAAAGAFLFLRAARAGAWSGTFALAGTLLSADVVLLALLARATIG
jgi:hypothetical protein